MVQVCGAVARASARAQVLDAALPPDVGRPMTFRKMLSQGLGATPLMRGAASLIKD